MKPKKTMMPNSNTSHLQKTLHIPVYALHIHNAFEVSRQLEQQAKRVSKEKGVRGAAVSKRDINLTNLYLCLKQWTTLVIVQILNII